MISADFSTPALLIESRMRAFEQSEFSLVYDSYHIESPFLQHFTDKSDYLSFAGQELGDIVLAGWKMFGQRQINDQAVEVLLWMQMGEGEDALDLFELALLLLTKTGWRYHSAQKLTREDYAGDFDQIEFCHFDQAAEKIRF